jgi:hypothetical protein
VALAEEIERERKEREKMQRGEDTSATNSNMVSSASHGEDVAMSGDDSRKQSQTSDDHWQKTRIVIADSEGDIKMEEGTTS